MTCSVFVLFLYKCNRAEEFYTLRFCIGLFESAAWPGIEYILGCWYPEVRSGSQLGTLCHLGRPRTYFSGDLQAALFSSMGGRLGLRAWRWLFIFDFLSTISVAIYGITCRPDTPETTKAFYLNDSNLVKKSGWLTIPQNNSLSTAIGAVNFFTMVSTGYMADKIGSRAPVCLFVGCLLVVNYTILSAWDVPHTAPGCWCNELCGGNQQERALILGFMTSVGPAVVFPFQQLQLSS
ncbi:MFS transporter ACS family pantothenate transporter [Microdochium nivale]|nr:MFS transporter ACS family pantothenate transporter [Microdochium nivale]